MGRERAESRTARFTGRIQSALSRSREQAEQRRIAHETGHTPDVYPEIIPGDQPIVIYECKDLTGGDPRWLEDVRQHNAVYNQSVSLEWQQGPNEDEYRPDVSRPTRIDPSS